MNLDMLILFFSIVGALFSFLIWRSGETRGLYSQQEIIRKEHLTKEDDEPISIPFNIDESFIFLLVSIEFIKCQEPSSSRVYRVRRFIFGSDGNTTIEMTLKWSKVPEEMPALGAMDLGQKISELHGVDEFDGRVMPSGFGRQTIKIHSTRPSDVDEAIYTFLELVEEAVHYEIEEHETSGGPGAVEE